MLQDTYYPQPPTTAMLPAALSAHYPLPTVPNCPSFTAHCPIPTAHTAYCLLPTLPAIPKAIKKICSWHIYAFSKLNYSFVSQSNFLKLSIKKNFPSNIFVIRRKNSASHFRVNTRISKKTLGTRIVVNCPFKENHVCIGLLTTWWGAGWRASPGTSS